MKAFAYFLFLRFFGGRSNWHNRSFTPDLQATFDHEYVYLWNGSHRMKARWYSTLNNTMSGRCNIVLSGPSIKTISTEKKKKLGDVFSIWVNNSPILAEEIGLKPSLYLVSDHRMIARHIDNFMRFSRLSDSYVISYHVAEALLRRASPTGNSYIYENLRRPFRRARLNKGDEESFPATRNGIWESDSVVIPAVRLAMFMGFKEIYIFGLDLNGALHFFPEKKLNPPFEGKNFRRIVADFRDVAREAERQGVKIINCSPNSRLGSDILEKRDPDSIL